MFYSSRFVIPEAVFGKPCNAGRVIEAEGDRHTGYGIKRSFSLFVLLFVLLSFAKGATIDVAQFRSPSPENRPWVYWFWNNGNLTQEGIDADLEAMHRVGIGGVLIMEVGQGAPRGPVDYMSDRWRELFKHMIIRAASLGIEVNMNDGPGWNGSGGPWVKPENAMKVLTFQIVEVPAENRPEKIVFPPGVKTFDYYKDLCVLAFPTPKVKTDLGFLSADSNRLNTSARQLPAETFIPLDTVIDLSGNMNDAGEVHEGIPAGNWTLIRFGITCKNMVGLPAPESGIGPECDKLSKCGIDNAFDGQIAKLLADNKANVGKAFVATHIDSWENGSQNWTDTMREEFLQRRKYDLWKFLPIFAGYVMENPEYTERFLWDFRRTVSELVLENYAGRMKELAAQNGLRFTIEAYGSPCDFLQYGGIADEPMGEFWVGGGAIETCRGMASAGHLYGKRIIGAEAFTATDTERWLAHPGSIKVLGDRAFCAGINRFVFHRYSFQPWKDVRPGLMMGPWGVHYERTQTWWNLTPAWHEYLSRCQYLLRQGDFAADILYLEPEDSPQGFSDGFSDHPRNEFPWDQGNTDVVLRATVENGMVVLPSGMKYRVLVMPPTNCMTEQLLEKTLQLVQNGATVIGNQPATAAPGLTDYPNNDKRVQELARKLWGDAKQPSGEHVIGQGKILWGTTPEAVLAAMNIVPDFVSDIPLNWIHRRLPDAEVYFVANPHERAVRSNLQLRSAGVPELWNPETGAVVTAAAFRTDSKTTHIMLPLRPTESVFVVLKKASSKSGEKLVAVTKDGKRFFDLTEPIGDIVITSAKYGPPNDPAKTVDVKPLVEKLVAAGERRIVVRRMVAHQGDPAFNVIKTLTIHYEMDGVHYTVTGDDEETLVLGERSPSIKILSAKYGPPGDAQRTIDVKEKLQRLFDCGDNHFLVAKLAQPVDPAFGVVKTLTFEYEWEGNTISWSGTDVQLISLENGAPLAVVPLRNDKGQSCADFYESGKYELTFASNKKRTETVVLPEPLNLDAAWSVAFPHKTVTFDKLMSWSDSADETIRFFSGTATYTKTFSVTENLRRNGLRFILDLGKAEMMAQVELNGKDLGVLWKTDKTMDVTEMIKSGENRLKISVTNSWTNRLIGDAALPPSDERNDNGTLKVFPQWLLDGKPDPNGRTTFCMWNLWKKDDTLVPSGLLGPVRLLPIKRIVIE